MLPGVSRKLENSSWSRLAESRFIPEKTGILLANLGHTTVELELWLHGWSAAPVLGPLTGTVFSPKSNPGPSLWLGSQPWSLPLTQSSVLPTEPCEEELYSSFLTEDEESGLPPTALNWFVCVSAAPYQPARWLPEKSL